MLDLYCGRGGWTRGFQAHGFTCYGFDIDSQFRGVYPGTFIRCDILKLTLKMLRELKPRVGCASSPCEEFTRHRMPWTRRRNPPPPTLGVRLAHEASRIASGLGVPLIFENVLMAQEWLGPAVMHIGPFYFWGDGIPGIWPHEISRRVKESYTSADHAKRAEIPFEIAEGFARYYA